MDDYERMIANVAFVGLNRRVELIHGEMREMSLVGPYHYDYINFLTCWSTTNLTAEEGVVQIQGSVLLDGSLPEPDVL